MIRIGWPFLVTCNRALDYRAVVAPDFVVQVDASKSLADAVGTDSDGGEICYREVTLADAGIIFLFFRTVPATADLIGETGGGVLRDDWGRPIYLIEGLILDSPAIRGNITEEDFLSVHKSLIQEFRQFWPSTEWVPRSVGPVYRLADGELGPGSS